MRKTHKKLLALFLSIAILLLSAAIFNVSAETVSSEFENIEELELVLNDIFSANESEFVDLVKEQKEQTVEDKYITLYENCGLQAMPFRRCFWITKFMQNIEPDIMTFKVGFHTHIIL